MSSISKFVSSHKAAVAITAVVGVGSVAGALYYLKKQQDLHLSSTTASESSASKKKKSKKSKKSKKATNESSTDPDTASSMFPVNPSTGLPEIDQRLVDGLSAEDKEKCALVLKESGNDFFKKKQYENAIAYYTAALLYKVDPVFYANRAACHSALQDNQKSIEDCTEALKINPSYSKCLLRRAHAYESLELYDEAMYDLTALTIYGGLNDRSNEAILERVLKKHSSKINEEQYSNLPKELPSTSSLSSFFGAFTQDLLEVSEDDFAENSAEKFLLQGLAKMKLDTTAAYEEADVLFNQAVSAYNADPSAVSDKALAALAFEYKGAFDFLKTKLDEGVESLNTALELNARPRSYVISGLIAADKSDYAGAIAEFGKAIALNKDDKDIYYHYGQLFYLVGDLTKAENNFEAAKTLNSDNVYAYIQLACIAYRQGDVSKCDQLFKEAKSRFAVSPEVPNYYGEILFDRQDFQGALKQFDTAARLQAALPSFNIGALPLVNKAAVHQRLGDIESCITDLTKACDLDIKSEVARLTLGQVYLQQQNVDAAIKLFEEACLVARSNEDRTQAISLLEASKMQAKIRQDPVLSAKVNEIMRSAGIAA